MNKNNKQDTSLLTFGEHLEVMRKMLFRIIALVMVLATIIFCFKTRTFDILLAPKSSNFATYRWIAELLVRIGLDLQLEEYNISLINTELSSQFMTHITTSFQLGALLASPFIVFELFKFISPALYESERRYSMLVALIIYALFILGLLMSYYILFPISFRFLATYQVNSEVINTITLDSYISAFANMAFLTGIVFEMPVIMYILVKMGFINAQMLKRCRPYALIIILVTSAIITPPDIFTLILVSIPLYGLYEVSILTLPHATSRNPKGKEAD